MASPTVGPWIDLDVERAALREARQRRQQVASMASQFTPEQADYAVAALRRNPNLSAGLLQALFQEQPPEPVADAMAKEDDGGGIMGFLGDAVGEVVSTVTDTADWALSNVYEQAIKPTIRGVTALSEGLFEELIARPTSAAVATAIGNGSLQENYNAYGDSPGLNFLQGQGDLGAGFFAGGEAAAQSQRERHLYIDGERANFGTAIASGLVGHFTEPGSRAYDTVAGVAGFAGEVILDPLAWGTMGASKAVQASRALDATTALRFLEEAGGVNGLRRNTVLFERARDFLGNDAMLQRLADADAYTIRQVWANSPAHRLDLDVVRDLGAATDKAEVMEVLLRAVGDQGIASKGFYSGVGRFTRQSLVESQGRLTGPFRYFTAEGRLSGLSPAGRVSADDLGAASEKLDSLLRQGNVARETRARIFERVANLRAGDHDGLFDVVRDSMDEIARTTGDDVSISGLASEFGKEIEAFRKYALDAVDVPYAKRKVVNNLDGEEVEILLPTPQITSELNSLALTLPDPTDIRRAATQNRLLRSVYTSKGWDVTADSTRWITRTLFKPLAILRPAYVVRIGLEEQARLAAAHYDSILSHPFRFIQANIRNRKDLTDLLGNDGLAVARANDVITKDAYGVMSNPNRAHARLFTGKTKPAQGEWNEEFARGWRTELGQLSAAPEARKMVELRGDLRAFREWAMTDGRDEIARLAKVNEDNNTLLDFAGQFDEWADGLRRRAEEMTGRWDDGLVDDIVSGNIPYKDAAKSREFATYSNRLKARHNQGRSPMEVKVEHIEKGRFEQLNRATDYLFDHITGKPTSYLARFPAWRQSMIRRTGDLMDSLATDDLRREAFERAVGAFGIKEKGLLRNTDEFTELRKALDNSLGRTGGEIETINDLNNLVVTRSAQDVKELLFDVTQRGAGQQALEAVFPFLDAWKEVTVTWARLMKENPAFFVRAQAGYRELSEDGFFYNNEFGEEVFAYPGGGFLSSFVRRMNEAGGDVLTDTLPALAGAAADTVTGNTPDFGVNLEGSVQGLNLVAQGIGPGFGPVVQWGANAFQSPDLDGMREFLAPFGTGLDDPLDLLSPGDLVETLMPAWMEKLANALRDGDLDQRQWNSTVGDAMKALAATGDYGPADQDRLLEDAERFGKWLLVARGFTQFAGPTGPQATTEAEFANTDPTHEDWNPEIDPTGHWFSLGVLASDYYRLLRTYGPEQAAEKFYELYGAEPFFIAQAKSRGLTESPVSAEGDRWMRSNAGVVDDYPVVAGLFAPTDEDAELDFSVYNAQFNRGERQSLTPRQQQALANQVRARSMYQAVKDRVADLPPAQRDAILNTTQGRLNDLYPGWNAPVLGVQQGVRTADKIAQLERAVADPRLADNPLTEPLRVYLALRQRAHAEALAEFGLKTLSSDRVAHLRERLAATGVAIMNRYPAFRAAWSDVLAREVQ